MQLQLATWQEVAGYLEGASGVIIPVGSTEQHGPNGLIGTDAICAEVIARAVGNELEVLVTPTLHIGMAQHHLGFPGTLSLRPATLLAVVVDTVDSLARHGFDRFYFLNGHGGNLATLRAAVSELYAERSLRSDAQPRPRLRCTVTNWWMGAEVKSLARKLFGASEGSHATPSEVSLSYFAHPEAVKSVQMHPRRAPTGPIRDAQDYKERFPDGRIGSDPSLASVEAGASIYHAAVNDVVKSYKAFIAED